VKTVLALAIVAAMVAPALGVMEFGYTYGEGAWWAGVVYSPDSLAWVSMWRQLTWEGKPTTNGVAVEGGLILDWLAIGTRTVIGPSWDCGDPLVNDAIAQVFVAWRHELVIGDWALVHWVGATWPMGREVSPGWPLIRLCFTF